MAREFDWKGYGKYRSFETSLFTICRDTLGQMGIGLEIIEWLVGEGKECFKKFLRLIGQEFLKTKRVRVLSDTAIEVNLGAPPVLPFSVAEIEFQVGSGWVKVEKRNDELYVNGHRVILYLSEHQGIGNMVLGYEIRKDLLNKPVLHPNIMDALVENPHLIPENWKKGLFVFFWGAVFNNAHGRLCVRDLNFNGERWCQGYDWLGGVWSELDPAAALDTNCADPVDPNRFDEQP